MPAFFYKHLSNQSPFKKILPALALAFFICGCAGTTPVGNKFLATASSSDLKASLVIGKTTRDEVITMYGQPYSSNTSSTGSAMSYYFAEREETGGTFGMSVPMGGGGYYHVPGSSGSVRYLNVKNFNLRFNNRDRLTDYNMSW